MTLDKPFFQQEGGTFRYQEPQSTEECINLINSYSDIVYLQHSAVTIQLKSPQGPQTRFKIFGSPYVPARGNWAFGYDHHSSTAERIWSDIPLDADVVLTHTPAYNHRDASPKWGAAGCEGLRKSLWQVRPRLAICGHVHEARGVERVIWKLDLAYSPFLEETTLQWTDPGAGNNKMSLVNVTGKGGNPLQNNGAFGTHPHVNDVAFSSILQEQAMSLGIIEDDEAGPPSEVLTLLSSSSDSPASRHVRDGREDVVRQPMQVSVPRKNLSRLHHRNTAALHGRTGRAETLFVNAAIMAKSYGNGPKRSNKPIVVDLELPVGSEFASVGGAERP